MIFKEPSKYLLLIHLFFILNSCHSSSTKVQNHRNKPIVEVNLNVIDIPNSKILLCYLRNKDSSIYIPKNSSLSKSGDTLYIEAVYKKRNESDVDILYNQFTPPEMEEIDFDSSIIKKIDYSKLSIESLSHVAVRVFECLNPYDPNKNFDKYHSIDAFLAYEKESSLLVWAKVIKANDIKSW